MLTAMGNVVPSHLMDRNLYPFTTLQPAGVADAGGDKAFDDDETLRTAAARDRAVALDPRGDAMNARALITSGCP